jgi:hypothetical protein
MTKHSSALIKYLELERELFAWRAQHPEDTPHEDELLEKMDKVWRQLSDAEVAYVNARPRSEHGKGPQER